MSKQLIAQLLQSALANLKESGTLAIAMPDIQVDATKDKLHGDFASNIALVLAKQAACKPRDLAEKIVAALPASTSIVKVAIAGPGFINFFLSSTALYRVIADILQEKENFGRTQLGQGKRVLVEFVSSNPTGPLHVGHGRHAAYGAVICNLLEMMGYQVHREYYVNDAGRQMDIIAVSVWLRYLALCGMTFPFPANGYQGQYVTDVAQQWRKQQGETLSCVAADLLCDLPLDEAEGGDKEGYMDALIARVKTVLGDTTYEHLIAFTLNAILTDIRRDLEEFGVFYHSWFSEREFVKTGIPQRVLATLKKNGWVYERSGALWFRSTDAGDDKDRVLYRANGQPTYFMNDLAYHVHKFEQGFDLAIDVFGSDHHGYIPRMKAGLQACGVAQDRLTYLLLQFVTLHRGGSQVQMSTRSGSFVTLRALCQEVGKDAARYFYVMRKGEQHVDFDLDLAKSQSNENPVYYIQYAHARICSVLRQLAERSWSCQIVDQFELLIQPHEIALLSTLSHYPDKIKSAAMQHEPAILTHYLRELATEFHAYYNSHQFLVEDGLLRNARLTLIMAIRQVIVNGLTLLGVSAPDNM